MENTQVIENEPLNEINKDVFPEPLVTDEELSENDHEHIVENTIEEQQTAVEEIPDLTPIEDLTATQEPVTENVETNNPRSAEELSDTDSYTSISHEASFYISNNPKDSLFYQAENDNQESDTDSEPEQTDNSRVGESISQVMERFSNSNKTSPKKCQVQFEQVDSSSDEELVISEKPVKPVARRRTPQSRHQSDVKKPSNSTTLQIWNDSDEVKREAEELNRQKSQQPPASPAVTTSAQPTQDSVLTMLLAKMEQLANENKELRALVTSTNISSSPSPIHPPQNGGVTVHHHHYYAPTNPKI